MIGQSQLLRRQLLSQMCACAAATSAPPMQQVLQTFDAAALQQHKDHASQGDASAGYDREPFLPLERVTVLAAVLASSAGGADPIRQNLGNIESPACLPAALLASLTSLAWRSGARHEYQHAPLPLDYTSVADGVATLLNHSPPGALISLSQLTISVRSPCTFNTFV